jgi:hypothetical protein
MFITNALKKYETVSHLLGENGRAYAAASNSKVRCFKALIRSQAIIQIN